MSTPLEERVARLEQRADDKDAVLLRMEGKLDTLLTAFNMGKGAWKATMKIGAIAVLLAGAFSWFWQYVLSPLIGKH